MKKMMSVFSVLFLVFSLFTLNAYATTEIASLNSVLQVSIQGAGQRLEIPIKIQLESVNQENGLLGNFNQRIVENGVELIFSVSVSKNVFEPGYEVVAEVMSAKYGTRIVRTTVNLEKMSDLNKITLLGSEEVDGKKIGAILVLSAAK